jgi:hypothetical protein
MFGRCAVFGRAFSLRAALRRFLRQISVHDCATGSLLVCLEHFRCSANILLPERVNSRNASLLESFLGRLRQFRQPKSSIRVPYPNASERRFAASVLMSDSP